MVSHFFPIQTKYYRAGIDWLQSCIQCRDCCKHFDVSCTKLPILIMCNCGKLFQGLLPHLHCFYLLSPFQVRNPLKRGSKITVSSNKHFIFNHCIFLPYTIHHGIAGPFEAVLFLSVRWDLLPHGLSAYTKASFFKPGFG